MRIKTLRFALGSAALALTASLALAQPADDHRELGAHQHGHGTFNLALEGDRVTIDFEAPGVDIVGFEHAPKTEAEKAAIAAAKQKLAEPLTLFGIPADAQCKVGEAAVALEGAHEGHDHGDKGEGHTEFQAQYLLQCANVKALTRLDFQFFAAFKGAAELAVVAISEKGQVKAEATRDKPRIDLAALH